MLKFTSDFRALAFGSMLGLAVLASAGPNPSKALQSSSAKLSPHQQMLRHEAKFYENKGQWDRRGQFLTRRPDLDVWFEDRGVDFDYYRVGGTIKKRTRTGQAVSMQFAGAKGSTHFFGVKPTGARNDYLKGSSRVYQVKGYSEVYARSVFPGIDLRGYASKDQPRYDFVVAPHADSSAIKLIFKGADKVFVHKGAVVLDTHVGKRLQGDLHAYQEFGGRRRPVPAQFQMLARNEVGVKLGAYDHSHTLVVDPLVYGSYYGGDGGFDEVRSVVADATLSGGVYMTGDTQSSNFPAIYGPYGYNLSGFQNAFVSKLQGDAYNQDYAAFIGGSASDTGQFLKLDPFGNLWMAGTTTSSDFPGNTRLNKLILSGDPSASAGTFVLTFQGSRTQPLAYTATPADVFAALQALPGMQGNLYSVTNPDGAPLYRGGHYEIDISASLPGLAIQSISRRIGDNVGEYSSGLQYVIVNYYSGTPKTTTGSQTLTPEVVEAIKPSFFSLTFTDQNGVVATTTPLDATTATPAKIQAALAALANVGANNVTVVDAGNNIPNSGNYPGTIAEDKMKVTFGGTLPVQELPLQVNDISLQPKPSYDMILEPFVFALQFHPDPQTVLSPLPTHETSFGHAFGTQLNGFDVRQVQNPKPTDPVDLVFTGSTDWQIPEYPGIPYDNNSDGLHKGFMVRMNFTSSNGYVLNGASSNYLISPFRIHTRGVALDGSGNCFIAGTVEGDANYDTATNPVFTTTPNVFFGGRLLRGIDIFVQKYDVSGSLVWSGLLGGHADDYAGGFVPDLDGSDVATGSAIALDTAGNVYVTGISHSYDFPRTRGVYGEVFTDGQNITVTKISGDGSSILYSTNLRANGLNYSAGLSVDERGDVFVTGNGLPDETFPEDVGQTPGNPDQPISTSYPTVGTTSDAFTTTFTGAPAAPEIGVQNAWLNVLNPDATKLTYGTYLGGTLDSRVYGPYVDAFGDCWVYGWIESFRRYTVDGGKTYFTHTAALPGAQISSTAFKPYPDNSLNWTFLGKVGYGFYDPLNPQVAPHFIATSSLRDGWVTKLRVGIPSVQSLTFNPVTIPGGFGATSTGTVTLTGPAPSNGAVINISILSGTGASFDPSNPNVTTTSVTIPAGGTSATFTVYSQPVPQNEVVTIQANYLGSFLNAALNVVPDLTNFSVSPTTVVGGNSINATVTLYQAAPAGGVTINLETDSPGLILLPTPPTVTVPVGQTSVTVQIPTAGVVKPTNANISATLAGFTLTQQVTLTPASLASMTFVPNPVPAGSTANATVFLNGLAGSDITVTITGQGGSAIPAGYTVSPTSFVIKQGTNSGTFTVTTPFVGSDTTVTLQANMGGQGTQYASSQTSATLQVRAYAVQNLTITPSQLTAGQVASGVVTVSNPAPAGGLLVNLSSSDPSSASVPGQITIAEGKTSSDPFTVTGGFPDVDKTVTITASRGPSSATAQVTVQHVIFTLGLTPAEVPGGNTSTAALTIPTPAPAGGLTLSVSVSQTPSSPTAVTAPSTVTIAAGATEVDFPVSTQPVTTQVTATVTATYSQSSTTSESVSAQLVVDPVGIASISFAPNPVHGGRSTIGTITLNGNAIGDVQVVISSTNPYLILPTSVTIKAGTNSATFTAIARRVSRAVSTTVTATYNGQAQTVVTVLR